MLTALEVWQQFAAVRLEHDVQNELSKQAESASPTTGGQSLPTTEREKPALSTTETISGDRDSRSRNDSIISPSALTSNDSTDQKLRQGTGIVASANQTSSSPFTLTADLPTIMDAIHRFIQEERLRNFDFLGKYSHCYMRQEELLVVSPATADDVQPIRMRDFKNGLLSSFSDDQFFVFKEPMDSSDFARVVAITIPHGQAPEIGNMSFTIPLPCGTVEISRATTWIRYTYTWVDDASMKFSALQYEEQQLWWNAIAKPFKFMDLPAELREAVYLQIIGPIIVPDLHQSRVTFGKGVSYDKDRLGKNRDPDIDCPNMTIMRVSRRICREATTVAKRNTMKRLRMVGSHGESHAKVQPLSAIAPLVAAMVALPASSAFLRHIQLEMSASCYFAFIDVHPFPGTPLATATTSPFRLDTLRTFRGLQHLDFRFIGPKHPDAVCPWALLYDASQYGEHSCQKTWIDWFFILASDRLKALKAARDVRYTLSGCVKPSKKQYWERALNSAATDLTAAEEWLREQKTADTPAPCTCLSPCSRGDAAMLLLKEWDPEDLRRMPGLQEHVDGIYWSFEE